MIFLIKGTWLVQNFNSIFGCNNIENYTSNLLLYGNGFLVVGPKSHSPNWFDVVIFIVALSFKAIQWVEVDN
jgi:hypothetical protein